MKARPWLGVSTWRPFEGLHPAPTPPASPPPPHRPPPAPRGQGGAPCPRPVRRRPLALGAPRLRGAPQKGGAGSGRGLRHAPPHLQGGARGPPAGGRGPPRRGGGWPPPPPASPRS